MSALSGSTYTNIGKSREAERGLCTKLSQQGTQIANFQSRNVYYLLEVTECILLSIGLKS